MTVRPYEPRDLLRDTLSRVVAIRDALAAADTWLASEIATDLEFDLATVLEVSDARGRPS